MKQGEMAVRVEPAAVIAEFLQVMTQASRKTYPTWQRMLVDGVSDVAPEGTDLYRQLIEYQPLEDFYFAGVVALEASKIRKYVEPILAGDLLIALAAQVDRIAGRPDRIVADFVFSTISRLEVEAGVALLTMPYDQVVHLLLNRIGLFNYEATRPLLTDFAFRHSLGEPLARGVPQWWKTYGAKLKRQVTASTQLGHVKLAAE
jgi:hypothetical protein